MSKKFISTAKNVIDLEIKALQKLKKTINNSFDKAVIEIAKCQRCKPFNVYEKYGNSKHYENYGFASWQKI